MANIPIKDGTFKSPDHIGSDIHYITKSYVWYIVPTSGCIQYCRAICGNITALRDDALCIRAVIKKKKKNTTIDISMSNPLSLTFQYRSSTERIHKESFLPE